MEQVSLRNSGIKVSKIGMGVWQASDEWHGDDQEVIEAVRTAQECGVNLIDTAEAYGMGHSEEVLGKALKQFGRDNFVVATKVFGAHLRQEALKKAAYASLQRLGINEIDVYQVHWPDPWEQIPLKETMSALEKLYLEGKIRAIAVSNFAPRDLEEASSYLSRTEIVSNQVRYNLVQRDIEEETLPYCKRENIRILAWSPLAQGALTGKYSMSRIPEGDVRKENILFNPKNMEEVEKMLVALTRVAQHHGVTVSQVALNWLASNPMVIPIPGAKNPMQAKENAGALGFNLTRPELDELESASRSVKIDYYPTVELVEAK